MLPNVTFHDPSGTFTFTLWRDDKEVIHELKGLNVGLDVIPDGDYDKTKNVKHYIYVKTYDSEDILIWLSKDEYDVLDPIMYEIEEDIYHNFYECEFTRTTLKDMAKNPTNYGPEQLARAMMNEMDEIDDDCHDAYREHPLDHE